MTPLVLKPSEGCRDSTGPPQRSERTSAQGLALGNVPSSIEEKARGFTARRLRSTTEATTLRTSRAAMLSPDTWRGVPPAEKSAIDLRRGLPRLPRLRSGAGRAARKKDGVGSRGITCDLQRKAKALASGEVYDEKDYRRIRFVDRQKEVNENFAIDLIAQQPVNEVDHRIIACDGGGGALGHPKVYINLDKETKTGTCGYCGLQFKQQHH